MTTTRWVRTRRQFLAATASGAAAALTSPLGALATPAQVEDEIKKQFIGKVAGEGKINLELPSIAENGLVVPLSFEVESPMMDKDYVKKITFYAEGNPNPTVATFNFSPSMPDRFCFGHANCIRENCARNRHESQGIDHCQQRVTAALKTPA